MSETLTACQSVCQDFSWLVPFASVAANFAIFVGVLIAYWQLNAWKVERATTVKYEVALELLVLAHEVSDTLSALRTPIDGYPSDENVDVRQWRYQVRLDRFKEASGLFERLRSLKIRASALLEIPRVDEAIEELLDVRRKTIGAILTLANRSSDHSNQSDETRQLYFRLQNDMWGTYGEKFDPLGMRQLKAIEILENELLPVIGTLTKR